MIISLAQAIQTALIVCRQLGSSDGPFKPFKVLWCEIFGFFSSLVPSKQEKNVLVVFTFQFLNDTIHN